MNWIWITIIIIIVSAIINPILYFIYWELYKRKDWIKEKNIWKSDERFFNYESYWEEDPNGIKKQYTRKVQITPVRPQIRDVWNSIDSYWIWWFPGINSIVVVFYICAIIARPFEQSWMWLLRKIANIKV